MQEHLKPEEIARYGKGELELLREREIDSHLIACEWCLSTLTNALWDRLERSVSCASASPAAS
jgi:hypothetical protein